MNQSMKAVLAATVVLGAASSARADLTINGAVGLPLNPTAQIPQEGGVRVQGNYYDQGDLGAASFKSYGVVAAGRVADMIEVSGGFNKFDVSTGGPLDESGIALGAKYLFTRESDPVGVRIAAGVGYDRALLKNTHAYVVGTKYLGAVTGEKVPITAHLGLRYDRFKAGAAKSNKASVFAGVEFPFTSTGEFAFVGEVQSKNNEFNNKIPYSASVRYRPQGQGFSVSAGIARQGLTGDNGLFAQVGYSFGR